jgi:ribosomal protein L4
VASAATLNVHDVLGSDRIAFTKDALERVTEVLRS